MSIEAVSWNCADLPVLDEAGMAEWHRARGKHVVEHRGRFWVALTRGFFQPVHTLASLRRDEATRPAWWCVGFRARLAEGDEAATGSIPAHLMDRVDRYDLARLSSRRRQQINQALRNLDIVVLRTPELVLDRGYSIVRQAHTRNPHIPLPDVRTFERDLTLMFVPPRGLVLAALRGDRLLGFATGFAVDALVYHDVVYVGDEGLPHNVSLCLFHALATLAARRGSIRELMHGVHIPEDAGLVEFKRRLGLKVTPLPAHVWFAPGVGPLLRRFRPRKYYRWAGGPADTARGRPGETVVLSKPAP